MRDDVSPFANDSRADIALGQLEPETGPPNHEQPFRVRSDATNNSLANSNTASTRLGPDVSYISEPLRDGDLFQSTTSPLDLGINTSANVSVEPRISPIRNPHGNKKRILPKGPVPVASETKRTTQKVRGKLTEPQRIKAKTMRRVGECLRCKQYKLGVCN